MDRARRPVALVGGGAPPGRAGDAGGARARITSAPPRPRREPAQQMQVGFVPYDGAKRRSRRRPSDRLASTTASDFSRYGMVLSSGKLTASNHTVNVRNINKMSEEHTALDGPVGDGFSHANGRSGVGGLGKILSSRLRPPTRRCGPRSDRAG